MTGDEGPAAWAAIVAVALMLLVILLPRPSPDEGPHLPRQVIAHQQVANARAPAQEGPSIPPVQQAWQDEAASQQVAWEEQGLAEDAFVQNVANQYLPQRRKGASDLVEDKDKSMATNTSEEEKGRDELLRQNLAVQQVMNSNVGPLLTGAEPID